MAHLPRPVSGLVIGYSYLWEAEFREGREEGVKDRPCAIVITSRTEEGDIVVTVAAITHSPPARPQDAIELPMDVKTITFGRAAFLGRLFRTQSLRMARS